VSWFQAFILGAVQGFSEFLPVSSSGHLVLVPWIFGWQDPGLAFDVFLHLGTACALILYFWSDLWRIFWAGLRSVWERRVGYDVDRMLFWWIVWGTIPAVVLGFSIGDWIEATFRSPLLVAFFLALFGFIIYWFDERYPATRSLEELSWADSLLIGFAQALALIPGVSRSGSTMAIARRLGFNRYSAARFSFLLSVPVVMGALGLESRNILSQLGGSISLGYLVTGFLSSFFVGLISIHFLLEFLKQASLRVFAWYRLFVAIAILLMSVTTHY